MKKYIFITLLFICTSFLAQTNKDSKEKITALKVAFLTQELELSTKDAQKFWPIYNKFEKSIDSLRNQTRNNIRNKLKSVGAFDDITEEEAKSFVKNKINVDKKILIEKDQFFTEISKILSYKKILKLHLSEKDFARKLMKKYGRNHQ